MGVQWRSKLKQDLNIMSLVTFFAFVATFFVVDAGVYITLTSWTVKQPIAVAIAAVVGVLCAIFATLAVSPLIGA